ncbi:MAG: PqqD family protein [Planctomycetota bacterium]|jgi:hypothetical protein
MSLPTRRPELTYEEIEETGELIVTDPVADRATVLNPTAGFVWLLCDGATAPAAIAAEMVATLGDAAPDPATVEQDVQRFLEELAAKELLVAAGAA